MANLLSNTNVTGSPMSVGGSGEFIFSVDGTFGGATVTLQLLSPDGTSWLSITDAALTAEGAVIVALGGGSRVRALVAGGTPSALYANLG